MVSLCILARHGGYFSSREVIHMLGPVLCILALMIVCLWLLLDIF